MKILGSDYDGTLNHGGMYADKLAKIRNWREEGNVFGIISGRDPGFSNYLNSRYPDLEYDFYAACNGGYIVDQKGNVLYEARSEGVSAYDLAADLFAWGCFEAHVEGERKILVLPEYDGEQPENDDRLFLSHEKARDIDYFNQVSVQLHSDEEAAEVAGKVNEKYGDRLNALLNGECIDIVPAGVNKARGMYRVMEYFGGRREDVITVGDNINDVDMLREFRSYAMKSGVPEALEAADMSVYDVSEILERECHDTAPEFKPGIYRHYKGNLYELFDLARHSETLEPLFVYKSVETGEAWARPAHMWGETVEVDGAAVPRFQLVEAESAE